MKDSPAEQSSQRDLLRDSTDSGRAAWLAFLLPMVSPVLEAAAEGRLGQTIHQNYEGAPYLRPFMAWEAFARTVYGIAPFLEADTLSASEKSVQSELRDLVQRGLAAGFANGDFDIEKLVALQKQPLVETAFWHHAIIHAPRALWHDLPDTSKEQIDRLGQASRRVEPNQSNWLLFSALVEAGRGVMGLDVQTKPITTALDAFEKWYLGDGTYGDGPHFRADYYNSFVIHPMLWELARVRSEAAPFKEAIERRFARHCVWLERQISPEGTLPPMGRSLVYRSGALHSLAFAAWRGVLPVTLDAGATRVAMFAVSRRLLSAPATYGTNGLLRIGFAGHQPNLGEGYITSGSIYLASFAFLPLGLTPNAPFWSAPDADWTSRRIYNGEPLPADKAID